MFKFLIITPHLGRNLVNKNVRVPPHSPLRTPKKHECSCTTTRTLGDGVNLDTRSFKNIHHVHTSKNVSTFTHDVNPNQGFVPKEFSFLFKKFNLQLLKFFNEVKSVFAIDVGIEKNLVSDNLNTFFRFMFFIFRRHSSMLSLLLSRPSILSHFQRRDD